MDYRGRRGREKEGCSAEVSAEPEELETNKCTGERGGGGGNANFAVGNLIISFRAGEFKDFIKSRLKCRRRVSTVSKISLRYLRRSFLSVSSFSSLFSYFCFHFCCARAPSRGGRLTFENGSDDDAIESRKGTMR